MPTFYLTTAIDYVNSRPHLGTAYEKIAADVIARYKRLAGFDTHFVMGNDEHSQNVFRRARELGEEPLAYCDRMAVEFTEVWQAPQLLLQHLLMQAMVGIIGGASLGAALGFLESRRLAAEQRPRVR